MIHGENLIVAINGTPLAASKSCNVSKAQSFLEVAAPTAGRWESFAPKTLGWKITADCLMGTMDAYKTLDAAWKAGTALTIRFYDTEYNENETGTAYIENLDLVATKGSLAKMSVSLKGSGPLSEYGGTYIPYTRSLLQTGKYYGYVTSTLYTIHTSEGGKIYGGTITLSKRTLVNVITNGNYIFFSPNSGLVTKATNAQDLTSDDYSVLVKEDGRIWLDAGTWYVVNSNPTYQFDPQLRAISI